MQKHGAQYMQRSIENCDVQLSPLGTTLPVILGIVRPICLHFFFVPSWPLVSPQIASFTFDSSNGGNIYMFCILCPLPRSLPGCALLRE